MFRFWYLLLALTCAAPAAQAQDRPAFDPAAAVGDALAKADAAGLFEVVPDDPQFATIRHTRSGLRCSWGPNDDFELTVYPPSPDLPRGDNVSCAHITPFGTHSLYAIRRSPQVTTKVEADVAAFAIKQRWPDAKPVRAPRPSGMTAILASQLPPSETRQFVIRERGERLMTRATVAQLGDWTFKLRYTGPQGMDDRADLVWALMMRDLTKPRAAPPAEAQTSAPTGQDGSPR